MSALRLRSANRPVRWIGQPITTITGALKTSSTHELLSTAGT